MYKNLVKRSWYLLFSNLKLFLPDLAWVLSTLFVGSILGYFTGFYELIMNGLTGDLIYSFLKENSLKLMVSAGILFFTTFVLGVSFSAFKYNMIKNVLIGKRKNIVKAFFESKKYFWKIVFVKVIVLTIFSTMLLSLFSLFRGIVSSTNSINDILGLIIIIISLMILLGISLFFRLFLLLRYPILILENCDATEAITKSYNLFRNNMKKVFFIWLISAIFSLIVSLIVTILSSFNLIPFLPLITNGILSFILMTWTDVYLFSAYKEIKS